MSADQVEVNSNSGYHDKLQHEVCPSQGCFRGLPTLIAVSVIVKITIIKAEVLWKHALSRGLL